MDYHSFSLPFLLLSEQSPQRMYHVGQDVLTRVNSSSITLLECVNNFLQWTGTGIPHALKAVTTTPAAMLGLQGIKGSLVAGADADLVIFSEAKTPGQPSTLVLDEVWKFGTRVHRAVPSS